MAYSRVARIGALTLLAVALAAGLGLPAIYTWFALNSRGAGWLSSDYMNSLMSGWAATVIGLGVGLPVALWVNRIALRDSEAKARAHSEDAASAQEIHVLSVIVQELREDHSEVTKAAGDKIGKFHFSVGRWNAIVAAGGLPSIRDFDAMQAAAEAYEELQALNQVAAQWLQTLTQPAAAHGFEDALHTILVSAARDAQSAINRALPLLEARIELVKPR